MSFPPINPDAFKPAPGQPQPSAIPSFASAYRPSQFFDNGAPELAEAPTGGLPGYSFTDGQFHNLFKREKNHKRQSSSNEPVAVSSDLESFESKKEIVKRDTSSDIKVRWREETSKNLRISRNMDIFLNYVKFSYLIKNWQSCGWARRW